VKPAYVSLIAVAALAACSSPSLAPAGWQQDGGAPNAWRNGSGASSQTYSFTRRSFSGALSDLASQVAIDIVLTHPGARLRSSNPLAPCPGAAGLATFTLPDRRTLQEGFAVHDGQARRATYLRPSSAAPDPAVTTAMQSLLC
jgi:hypothetical protein